MKQTNYQISELAQRDDLLLLRLKPVDKGKVFNFSPGQYATLSLVEGRGESFERSFSIASSPTTTEYLEFGIRRLGPFTHKLAQMKVGSPIKVRGPFGVFTYEPARQPAVVFIAGGIGITPFMSMIRYFEQQRLTTNITLLFSNRSLVGTPYLAELAAISKTRSNFSAHLLLTNQPTGQPPAGIKVINHRLSAAILQQVVQPLDNSQRYFLCGPSGFMDAAREQLIGLGIAEQNIAQEDFSFGPPKIRKSDLLFYIGGLGAASFITITILLAIYRVEAARTLANQLALQAALTAQTQPVSTTTTGQPTSTIPPHNTTPVPTVRQTQQPVITPSTGLS